MPGACRANRAAGGLGVFAGLCAVFSLSCSPSPTPVARGPVVPPKPRWEDLERARSWPLAGPPRASRGHGVDGGQMEVRVSPDAMGPYRDLVAGASVPAGAAVVAFQTGTKGAPGSAYAMTKLPSGEWEFIAADPDGTLLGRGLLASCASCHDDAPADHLFGVSHPVTPSNPTGN